MEKARPYQTTSHEHIEFLVNSANRVHLLKTLNEQPAQIRDLIDRCSLSRATVRRSLSGFTEREWVQREGNQHQITPSGRIVLRKYEVFVEVVESTEKIGLFLAHLEDIGYELPQNALLNATVKTTTPKDPYAAVTFFTNVLDAASPDQFRSISPIHAPAFHEILQGFISEGISIELIIDNMTLNVVQSTHPDALEAALSKEQFTLYRYPDDLSLGLTILDEQVLIGACDNHGNFTACIEATTDCLLDWATQIFESRRQTATRVGLSTLST